MEQIINEPTAEGWDSAFCPDPAPTGYDWAEVYIGGSSATHRWDDQELARVEHMPRLPVWVPTPGYESPRQVALQAAARMRALGIVEGPGSCGEHPCLMWDIETGKFPDPDWYNTAADVLWSQGYGNIGYGSLSTCQQLPVRSGLIIALPGTPPVVDTLPGQVGTQYRWGVPVQGGKIDQDVLRASAMKLLWQPLV